ncbi:MAG: ArsR/SmtB family transcription factor [Candidatus Omnitrophota bacterium]
MKIVSAFKALSDETRLRLLHLFLHYELNVNEIVAIMDMGQSRISRHLKILTDNQLLTFRRDGLWTLYSATVEGDGLTFIQSIKYLFDKEPIFRTDLSRAQHMLQEREIESTLFFDSIAENWEKLKHEILGDAPLNEMILDAIPPCDVIADLGCGTGDLLEFLKPSAHSLIGVEKSSKMLETARKRLTVEPKTLEVDLRIGELEHLPLREGEADAAVINMVLHHIAEPLKAIKEAYRAIKSHGVFILMDLGSHDQENMRKRFGDRWLGFSEADIRKYLAAAGFKIDRFDYFNLKKELKGFMVRAVKP